MKQFGSRSILSVMFVIFLGLGARVEASPVGASASLDSSAFQIFAYDIYGGGAPTWTISGLEKGVDAWNGSNNDSDYAADWSSLVVAQVTGASAFDDGALMSVKAVSGDASGYREAHFNISGSGLLVFSIPYEFHISDADQWVDASMYIWGDSQNFNYSASIGEYTPGDYSGNLNLAILVSDGESFTFEGTVDASASQVPIPSSLILLGLGLGGVLVRARKKEAMNMASAEDRLSE